MIAHVLKEFPVPLGPAVPPHLPRRSLFAATGALGAGALLTACGADEEPESGQGSGAWTFVDQRSGEDVELERSPATVVAFTGLAAALYDYGVEVAAVFGPTTLADGAPDLQAGRMPVEGLTVLGNAWGEFDIEAYAALGPDLLVSHFFEGFDLWFVPEDRLEEVESLAPAVGLRISSGDPVDDVLAHHAELAVALGADPESDTLAEAKARYDAAVTAVEEAAAANPVTVLACSAYAESLYVGVPDTFDLLAKCAELGVNFVVAEEPDEAGYWEPLSWENADKYDADLLLLDARSASLQPADLGEFPTWDSISAVAAGQIYAWNPEPIYSYVGAALILEGIAAAIASAEPVSG